MPVITILSGSNIGDRVAHLATALEQAQNLIGRLVARSAIYESVPWGFEAEQTFLNQVFCLETSLDTRQVLELLLGIEHGMGRDRTGRQGYRSRTIDLDILFHGERVIGEDGLTVPHPRIAERRFVLVPLAELMPGFIHPELGLKVSELLERTTDHNPAWHYQPPGQNEK
jgi:2-amino-4-hydroxy-6-hydroxymethyldihydropteridine diphosphokinase